MRGNLRRKRSCAPASRSIPAYAGKPLAVLSMPSRQRVYPRVCGETPSVGVGVGPAKGLSPRMRGNRVQMPASFRSCRSIPAYAGKPRTGRPAPGGAGVYPRVCGETPSSQPWSSGSRGLSPRMRGNRIPPYTTSAEGRSIPAYAGKPEVRRYRLPPGEVYPRVCGETSPNPWKCGTCEGLSPRMRGNRTAGGDKRPTEGSIPAYAGKPLSHSDSFVRRLSKIVRQSAMALLPPCAVSNSTGALHPKALDDALRDDRWTRSRTPLPEMREIRAIAHTGASRTPTSS